MTKTEEKFIRTWQATRAKGKTFYVIKFGLIWSVSCTIVNELGFYTIFNDGDYGFNIAKNLFSFGFTLIAGYFIGVLQWNLSEKRFHRIKEK